MRGLWFGTKLAATFSLVGLAMLIATAVLLRYTVGHRFHEHTMDTRASDGVLVTLELESAIGGAALDSAEATTALEQLGTTRSRELALLDSRNKVVAYTHPRLAAIDVEEADAARPCWDRQCRFVPIHPGGVVLVPMELSGANRGASLAVAFGPPGPHREWWYVALGLPLIYLLSIIGVIALSHRITGPMRRVTNSMDRVARGELDHRVQTKGRDEIAQMGKSFNAMADRVGSMIRSGKELLAGVSHELRSPLSRMKLSLEMLRDAGGAEKHVDSLEEDIDELDAMVDELLTASRLDLGTETLRPEAIAVTELAELGWHRAATGSMPDPSKLALDITPDDLQVRVDLALGARLLGNLLENARRHGDDSAIELKARREGNRVAITVSDNGPGVPEADLDHLFVPFFRSDKSRSRRTGGTGLGLMIVRRAVGVHGGTVSAANRPDGSGLAVTFDLPAIES